MRNELFGGSLGLLIAGTLCTTGVVPSASGQSSFTDGTLHPLLDHKPGHSGKSSKANGGVAGVGCEYANDDGENDGAFGATTNDIQVGAVAGYIAVDGCTSLTSIQVAWGAVTDGQACTLQIYNDPNKDGDPSDITGADQLVSVDGVVANPDTDIFNDYPIPATAVDGMFWVVAFTEDTADTDFPAQYTNSAAVSPLNVLLLGTTDLNDPFATSTVIDQVGLGNVDFMVRAVGDGAVVSCFGGDTNGDCNVDVTDLVNVITAWGGDGIGLGFNADINNDGTVDVTDLVNGVITNWGSCTCAARACCFQDGSCADLTPDGCFRGGGAIQAAGSTCDDTGCENLFGACCLAPGECVENLPADCTAAGGTHNGAGTTCASGICDPQSNDDCAGAIALEFGVTVMGTTANSNDDPDAEAAGCVDDNNNPVTTGGNWYKVTGNGNTLTATMCGDSSSYDAKLYIYCGTCEGFFCLAADDDGCGVGGGTSIVEWCSDPGQEYLVFVTGFAQSTGPYELVVNSGGSCGEPTPCQDNDSVCGFATDIAVGGSVLGYDTCEGIINGTAPDCGQGGQTAEGRWLRVIGDGTTLTVLLCEDPVLGFNSRLSAYCGPCDALQCVGTEPTNNSGCSPFTESLSFCSLDGAEYYILVSGSGECGTVDVSVTSDNTDCNNPPCAGACCLEDGTCVVDTEGACGAAAGSFFSETPCEEVFCFLEPCGSFDTTLSQTDSDVVVAGGGVACAGGGFTTENGFLRSFSGLGASFEVCSVNVGFETVVSADGEPQAFEIRLYDTALPATLDQLGQPFAKRTFLAEDQALTTVTFEITGITTTGNLTVEVFRDDDSANGNVFRVGGCNDPDDPDNPDEVCNETAPSYLYAPSCGIDDPVETGSIGFGDVHWVIEVNGNN